MRRGIDRSSSSSFGIGGVSIWLPSFEKQQQQQQQQQQHPYWRRRGPAALLFLCISFSLILLLVVNTTFSLQSAEQEVNSAAINDTASSSSSMDSILKGIKSMYLSTREGSPFGEVETIDGTKVSMSDYRGKVSLIVNVASF
jgi:hypothetical protein